MDEKADAALTGSVAAATDERETEMFAVVDRSLQWRRLPAINSMSHQLHTSLTDHLETI